MWEKLSNNLDTPIASAVKIGKVTKEIATDILSVYELYKTKTLFYTKDKLESLRDMVGLKNQNDYFGVSEIQALRNIVSQTVSDIVGYISGDSDIKNERAWWLNVEFQAVKSIPIANILLARANYEQNKNVINPTISKFAPLLDLSPELVLAVWAQESRFLPEATSDVWAQGIMQIMPATMRGIIWFIKNGKMQYAWPEERYYAQFREDMKTTGLDIIRYLTTASDTEKNLIIGMVYLGYLTSRYGEIDGLKRYNGGAKPSNTKENREYVPLVQNWKRVIIASSETLQSS